MSPTWYILVKHVLRTVLILYWTKFMVLRTYNIFMSYSTEPINLCDAKVQTVTERLPQH